MLAFLPDIAEEHFEELQFLWTQRRKALRSPAYTMRELGMLEERIEAHIQGLLVLGEHLLDFVAPGLAGDDEMPAFAAAIALLRLGTPEALGRVLDAFGHASGKRLQGIREALSHGPAQPLSAQLTSLFLSAAPAVGAAAGEALAFHGAIRPQHAHLERFLRDESAAVRAAAWRIAAACAVALPPEPYESGMRDEDPEVNRAALAAAAWNAYPGWAAYCRSLAAAPVPEALEPLTALAAMAPVQEFQTVNALAAAAALGPGRFRIVGAFGHPAFIDYLIQEMENPDPALAAAAGEAFAKITGALLTTDRRATVPPPNGAPVDEFEAEFLDEVHLPDPAVARREWDRLRPRLASATRVCRGIDVSQGISPEDWARLDMESRWELCLRARLTVGWQGTPVALERFPQASPSATA